MLCVTCWRSSYLCILPHDKTWWQQHLYTVHTCTQYAYLCLCTCVICTGDCTHILWCWGYYDPWRYRNVYTILTTLMCTGMHCTECGYNCHEKCVQHVPKNCTKIRPTSHLTLAAAANVNSQAAADSTLVASTTQSVPSTAAGMKHP